MEEIKFEEFKIIPLILAFVLIQGIFITFSETFGSLIFDIFMSFYFLYKLKKQNITFNYIKNRTLSFKQILTYFFISVLLLIFSAGCVMLVSNLLYLYSPDIAKQKFNSTLPTNLLLLFLITVIFAPILEEITFRGVILSKFSRYFNVYVGITLNSIVFAILYDNVIGTFVFAVTLSVIYLNTKNILIPIIIHMFNNLLAFIITCLPDNIEEQSAIAETIPIDECAFLIQFSLALIIIAGIPIIIYLFKNWHEFKLKQLNICESNNNSDL